MYFVSLAGVHTQLRFLTSYVAEIVYDGNINPPPNSTLYKEYTSGSLALGISTVVRVITSLGPSMKLFKMRLFLVGSNVVLMLQSGVLIVGQHVIVTIFLYSSCHIHHNKSNIYAAGMNINLMFMLASEYEAKGLLLHKTWPYPDAYLEAFALLINGPLTHFYGMQCRVCDDIDMCDFIPDILQLFCK